MDYFFEVIPLISNNQCKNNYYAAIHKTTHRDHCVQEATLNLSVIRP
ncbi:hypothetical protein LEP1GSC079_3228 [Leptospira interrogans str. FPW1039]|uniref:Uncharacterized protein n=2 Tax=Leptospira interrogans str. FPW1039 TaxID=1193040 RepID=A0A0F6IEC4_LEPIR|nr:hypothetical protein LEP1GSC079_3228 [Leptospira interrogans str. FPW1039]